MAAAAEGAQQWGLGSAVCSQQGEGRGSSREEAARLLVGAEMRQLGRADL